MSYRTEAIDRISTLAGRMMHHDDPDVREFVEHGSWTWFPRPNHSSLWRTFRKHPGHMPSTMVKTRWEH